LHLQYKNLRLDQARIHLPLAFNTFELEWLEAEAEEADQSPLVVASEQVLLVLLQPYSERPVPAEAPGRKRRLMVMVELAELCLAWALLSVHPSLVRTAKAAPLSRSLVSHYSEAKAAVLILEEQVQAET
jgi:hypothetical protein